MRIDVKRTVIIAEAGVNHGGDVNVARKMADAAKRANADIVKYQTYITEKIIRRHDRSFEELQALELSWPNWITLARHCEDIKIEFLTTPGEIDSLKFAVEELGVKRIKIGSDDLTNRALVSAAHKTGLPLILSTGMATCEEITDAVCEIDNFSLLHCVSLYPCRPDQANLRSIKFLAEMFRCPVGYSDHTGIFSVVTAAVAVGAEIIEVHFKLNNTTPIDNEVSFTAHELGGLIYMVQQVELWLGSYDKKPNSTELAKIPHLRKGPDGLRGWEGV